MNWESLLCPERVRQLMGGPTSHRLAADPRSEFERDYGRVLFSTPVRRLQDKAQVFPLEPHDAIRTRLTHSMEVSSVARTIAEQCAEWLGSRGDLPQPARDVKSIGTIAAACGILHDLGNPPFGHSGERAIRDWFGQRLSKDSEFAELVGYPDSKDSQLVQDFLQFEGNAQTIRLIGKLQILADFYGLNLTCATFSVACKYTAVSTQVSDAFHETSKLGFFASETELVDVVRRHTGTGNARHPLTYLVEAADDIVYSIVDLEDGLKKKLYDWRRLHHWLKEELKSDTAILDAGTSIDKNAPVIRRDQIVDRPLSTCLCQQRRSRSSDGHARGGTLTASLHALAHKWVEQALAGQKCRGVKVDDSLFTALPLRLEGAHNPSHMRLKRFARIAVVFVLLSGSTSEALEPGLPSKTAVMAAAARAVGSKNPDPKQRNPDYLAIKFLGPRERAILPDYPMDAMDLDFNSAMMQLGVRLPVRAHAFRTKAFDAALLEALRKGARQVVVLGAGFDSRGYRFQSRLRGVRFMEIDYGPTQEYKKQRVKEILGGFPANVSYVPMDFTKDSLLEQLAKAGYSEQQNTFFLWEGVTFYLPESAVKDTLHFVRDHAAPGSRIAFDYTFSKDGNVNNPQSIWSRWGEPWLFGFPDDGAAAYARREGLEVISDTLTVQNICIASVPKKN